MTKTLPLTTVAALVWNDAYCECDMNGHDPLSDYENGVPCETCLVTVWEEKVSECGDTFIDSIMTEGMLDPINLNPAGTRVMDGHHRLALAIMLMLDEVPVSFGYTQARYDLPDSYA